MRSAYLALGSNPTHRITNGKTNGPGCPEAAFYQLSSGILNRPPSFEGKFQTLAWQEWFVARASTGLCEWGEAIVRALRPYHSRPTV